MLTAPGNLLTMKTEARMGYISSFIIIAVVLLLNPSFGRAEVKEIVAEGTYNMGDGETPSVAESRALLNAKQVALEQAGTYVESYIKVENLILTKDEIQVLASGIMEVTLLDKKRDIVGDGFRFWVKIKARVELDKIDDMAKRVKEKSVVEDYKKVQEAYAKSEKEIEVLKKQLAEAKGEKQKKQVEARITDEERLFQANEWFEKGNEHFSNLEYDKAIEAFTSAIAFNSNYVEAYFGRGIAYYEKGQYDRAYEKGQYDRAIEDFQKACDMGYEKGCETWLIRAIYNMAIEDYNKAIAINPNDAEAYYNRGVAYYKKGQLDRAISDLQKACDMGNEDGCKGLQVVLKGR